MGNNPSVVRPPSWSQEAPERPKSMFPELPDLFGQQLNTDGAVYVSETTVPLGGVGLVLTPSAAQRAFVVINLVRNGPAHLSGQVHKGDTLLAIDGIPVYGEAFSGALPALCGPAGSAAVLELRGRGGDQIQVSLVRDQNAFPDELALVAPGFETVLDGARNLQPEIDPPPVAPQGGAGYGYASHHQPMKTPAKAVAAR